MHLDKFRYGDLEWDAALLNCLYYANDGEAICVGIYDGEATQAEALGS